MSSIVGLLNKFSDSQPMRNISPGEYYHIYNRGVRKQDIALDQRDYIRFLFSIIYFQSSRSLDHLPYQVTSFEKNRAFSLLTSSVEEIISERLVELVAFVIMPNHFHLLVKEKVSGGIAKYMQRVQNSYTKYFNTKYKMSGHLFEGRYKSIHIADDRQLLHTSAYIHRNPREIKKWKMKYEKYPWSSAPDFFGENRWGELLTRDILFGEFKTPKEYTRFVRTSPAKRFKDEIGID